MCLCFLISLFRIVIYVVLSLFRYLFSCLVMCVCLVLSLCIYVIMYVLRSSCYLFRA